LNKADDVKWSLVAVYGVAQDDFKADFLRELVNLAKDNSHPIIIGGDFNFLRFHTRNVEAILMIICLSCSTLSSIAWT
jgi:hypothetical protein